MIAIFNNKKYSLTRASVKEARDAGILDHVLPSGMIIPFVFATGEANSFVVGRDRNHTYLILCSSMYDLYEIDTETCDGGWPSCKMRKHVQEAFDQLPGWFKDIAMPLHIVQDAGGKTVECEDVAFLLSETNVFGDELLAHDEYDHVEFCHDSQIDIFMDKNSRRRPWVKDHAHNVWWWLRSPYTGRYFSAVGGGYEPYTTNKIECRGGVVFAVCIENRE